MQFCAILRVFSVNFGSWHSGIMTPKLKNINRVGKAHCMLAFLCRGSNAIEREKIFEKMIYK